MEAKVGENTLWYRQTRTNILTVVGNIIAVMVTMIPKSLRSCCQKQVILWFINPTAIAYAHSFLKWLNYVI